MSPTAKSKLAISLISIIAATSFPIIANAQNGEGADVEIRYTQYGVPHIKAQNLEGAAYGMAYAIARDNLCLTLERFVTIAGDRSKTLPPDAKYMDAFAGGEISNFDSDATYKYILSPEVIARLKTKSSADMHSLVRGYVRGFNSHLNSTALSGESCRQASWYRPINEDDIWRRIAHFPLLETTAGVLREVAAASPPSATQIKQGEVPQDTYKRLVENTTVRGASNAVAFGREATESRTGGQSFANPHYAWHGTERLYAFQITVPGRINVFGATAYGIPFPLMGFSDKVGWGITHTTNKRATLYELKLDANTPTIYEIDGKKEQMKQVLVNVPTKDGVKQKTFYQSRHGTVIEGEFIPWNSSNAYVWAEPELANTGMADMFLAIASAKSVRDIHAAQNRFMGSPWSNITATDASGEVYYSNMSVSANITDQQLEKCVITGPIHRYMVEADLTTLSGSQSYCQWTKDSRAKQEGVIPAQELPFIFRKDVVFNSNDSHWFTNLGADGRLQGYKKVIGPEKSIRGERTRIAALYAEDIINGSSVTGTKGATPAKWEKLFFSSRNIHAELILDDMLKDCSEHPSASAGGITVELAEACAVLAKWDRRDTLDSRGSLLFSQFLDKLDAIPMTGFALEAKYWRVPFDPNDPINTPRGFIGSDETRVALGRTVFDFNSLNVPLDATLRDSQSVTRAGKSFPLSGSKFGYHMVRPMSYSPVKGVTEIRSGDSYIHNVSIGPNGVNGRFIVSYSQSTNPSSEHYTDMLGLFSDQKFADVYFSESDIKAAQIGPSVFLKSGSIANNSRARRR